MNVERKKDICNFCGGEKFVTRRIEYLYSHEGKYLIVPNTPIEVCLNCGMIYYEASVLKKIEQRFFAIQQHRETPDRYIQVPTAIYA
jgi:YgiT-type zinc finger domain-containing protein